MHPRDQLNHWPQGRGLWAHVSEKDWMDWRWQMKNRFRAAVQLEKYLCLTPSEKAGFEASRDRLVFAVTPHFFNLIDRDDPECPIRRQVIPRIEETRHGPDETDDPLDEERDMAAPGLIHRYPDRALLLATDRCAAYCRYCTRSRLIAGARGFQKDFEPAFRYLEQHSRIRDVAISGGDPLLLADGKLDAVLTRLRAIPHIEILRIGTRVPAFLPQRITDGLTDVLKKHGPLWMSLHFNHPRECAVEAKQACERLALAGAPLGNQSVLLRGVNDDVETMKSLVHRLLMMRVRPYYLYQCDLVPGIAHLRADPRKGLEIIEALRGHTSGYAVPQFVIDAPGGGGKVPANPRYVEAVTSDELLLRNYEGRLYRYPLPAAAPQSEECSAEICPV